MEVQYSFRLPVIHAFFPPCHLMLCACIFILSVQHLPVNEDYTLVMAVQRIHIFVPPVLCMSMFEVMLIKLILRPH